MNYKKKVPNSYTVYRRTAVRDAAGTELIDGWIGTVFLAFFPIIVSILISLCRYASVDLNRMLGDGELILSAFLITTPTLINFYKENIYQKGYKLLFYLQLFAAFFQLVAYTSIKTNPSNIPGVVYITSGTCVIASIFISRLGEKCVKEDMGKL